MKKWSWLIVLLLTISTIPLPSKAGELSDRLQGYILLQVEENGEAWYVRKDTGERIYMADGEVAYNMMRLLGLGITNADLDKIPVGFLDQYEFPDLDGDRLHNTLESGMGTDKNDPDTDGDGYQDGTEVRNGFSPLGPGRYEYDQGLIDRVRGRILLQVERSGEAWYVNPVDGKRYYMPDGFSAFQIMRFLSLGITNSDLDQILIDTDFTLPEEHESTWQMSTVVDLDAPPFDPAIGDLAGEGWNYLYIPQSITGSDLTEVDYNDAWSDSTLGMIGGDPRFTAIGEIRSDKGLYISNTTGTITEVTILNGIVTFDDIDPGNL
ncbi:MAG: hypothetical protein KJ710_04620, partial [Candidatus Omnitrophica bacterium]|nr:hypothetical protein [Candidatus Omnitrophota bacterium]